MMSDFNTTESNDRENELMRLWSSLSASADDKLQPAASLKVRLSLVPKLVTQKENKQRRRKDEENRFYFELLLM